MGGQTMQKLIAPLPTFKKGIFKAFDLFNVVSNIELPSDTEIDRQAFLTDALALQEDAR